MLAAAVNDSRPALFVIAGAGPLAVSADAHMSVHRLSAAPSRRYKHTHFSCDGQNRPVFCLGSGKNKCEVTQWSPDAALPSYASSLRGVGASKFILSILPGGCSYAALFTVAES